MGVAAANDTSRQNARSLLANTLLADIDGHALHQDGLFKAISFRPTERPQRLLAEDTLASLKQFLLTADEDAIKEVMPALSSDVIACVVKLMSNKELIHVGKSVFNPLPGSQIGAKGYLGARIQPNSPTDNVDDIRSAIREQDGTEVKSVELEKLEIRAKATSYARDYFETLRDYAADLFSVQTGQPWMPARGSRTSRSSLTAAVVDSRDFLAATMRKKTLAEAPEGPKVVVAGGMDFNDHNLIFEALDKVLSKHPDMVLVHGGAPKGTDRKSTRLTPVTL